MIELIPAIDLIDGKCVRLSQGDYSLKKVYFDKPLDAAKQFEDAGIKRLHVVDLDGARLGKVVNINVLEIIAAQTKLVIDFGGGIKTDEDIQTVFDAGASMATIGSIAVKNKELFFSWVVRYGADKIFLGADVNKEMIAVSGWTETTSLSVFDFIGENISKSISNIFCTDIAKDGLLLGPSLELYKKIIAAFPDISLVASGGVSCLGDLDALAMAGCKGVIIGKAIYEGKITLKELSEYGRKVC